MWAPPAAPLPIAPPVAGAMSFGAAQPQGSGLASGAPVSEIERARWDAAPVKRFRRSLTRWGAIGGFLTVASVVTASSDLMTFVIIIGAVLALKYGKLWSNGYNWRDVFKQPSDRLFFDVAAESIDNARGLFDKNKRAEVRARLRRGAGRNAQLQAAAAAGPLAMPVAPMPPAAPMSPPPPAAAPPAPLITTPQDDGSTLAPAEVLNSRHGAIVRRAAGDGAAVRQEVGRLGAADRALLPDVVGVVEALVKRIASLATALHRLDGDLAPDALPELDKQIAAAEGSAATPDRERKLGLLRRQRATLQDLADRRAMLSAQLENAGIVLRNIRLDLVRLRSAGVQSAIDDVATATQEARALSREIAHVLNAAEELKSV